MPSLRRKPPAEEPTIPDSPADEPEADASAVAPAEDAPLLEVPPASASGGGTCGHCGGELEPFPQGHAKFGRSVCSACGRSTPGGAAAG